jgi:hypothetical protein
MKTTITLFIESDLKKAIADAAWKERTTLSELIRRVCAEYVKNQGVSDVSSDL